MCVPLVGQCVSVCWTMRVRLLDNVCPFVGECMLVFSESAQEESGRRAVNARGWQAEICAAHANTRKPKHR
eukprot:242703-Pleurochrysis_carterae.AAC.1